ASKSAGRDGVLCPQAVSDDQGPDQGKGKKSQADARAADVLGENGTELGAQGRAGMHHQGDEHVDVALERMGDRPEAGGDDHFEQVRADGDAGGDAQNINHRRHAYVTRASPEKTTEKTADECHADNDQKRNTGDTGGGKADKGRKVEPLDMMGDESKNRTVVF